jgi:hypothetical protein
MFISFFAVGIIYIDAHELSGEDAWQVAVQFSLHITRKLRHDIPIQVLRLPN